MSRIEVKELVEFKHACLQNSEEIIAQKYLIEGGSYFFSLYHTEDEEYLFKKNLAKSLDVHLRDICIVGSAKLGFSIKPDVAQPGFYPFKYFDEDFDKGIKNKKSDIDVAVISNELFDRQMLNIYKHTSCYENFINRKEINSLGFYMLKGWVYPKVLPKSYQLDGEYLKIKSGYEFIYGREINIGIYKSWYYFENYHQNNIKNLCLNLIATL
ncbi:hypothetical protein NGC85_16370 [Acinetobacter sp. Z1]|uniref:hypothetical protein n=1 Tax=Acinetobacter sp. Z1 TaxID=2953738 RepID=UPI0020C9370D|nr:hypothetical protein [Acinetobacter sp. Z1]UTO19443.1 hypothetical protein NGC85_16370 [Acinetobacter sp. Z1]